MTNPLVQGPCKNTGSGVSSLGVTMTNTPTSGNMLIAIVSLCVLEGETVSSISQTGVTWSKATQANDSSDTSDTEIWYGYIGSSPSKSLTVNLSAQTEYMVVDVCEFTGVATSSALDKTKTNSGTGTAATTGTTSTTSQANELWIGAIGGCSYSGGESLSSPLNSFTLLDGAANGTYYPSIAFLYYVASATGGAGSGATFSSGSNLYWAGGVATFLMTAGPVSQSVSDLGIESLTYVVTVPITEWSTATASNGSAFLTEIGTESGALQPAAWITETGQESLSYTAAIPVNEASTESAVNAQILIQRVSAYSSGPARATGLLSTTIPVTLPVAPTQGNALIAVISLQANYIMPSVSSITQQGVTWSLQVQNQASPDYDIEIWLGMVGANAGTSVTVTTSTAPNWGGVVDICEYTNNVASNWILDQTAKASGTNSTVSSTGTTSQTTQAQELWIGAIMASYNQSNPQNGFVLLDGVANDFTSAGYLEDIVTLEGQASSGTTIATASVYAGCIATFYAVPVEYITEISTEPLTSSVTIPLMEIEIPSGSPATVSVTQIEFTTLSYVATIPLNQASTQFSSAFVSIPLTQFGSAAASPAAVFLTQTAWASLLLSGMVSLTQTSTENLGYMATIPLSEWSTSTSTTAAANISQIETATGSTATSSLLESAFESYLWTVAIPLGEFSGEAYTYSVTVPLNEFGSEAYTFSELVQIIEAAIEGAGSGTVSIALGSVDNIVWSASIPITEKDVEALYALIPTVPKIYLLLGNLMIQISGS